MHEDLVNMLEIFYVDEVKQMANEPESLKSILLTLDR